MKKLSFQLVFPLLLFCYQFSFAQSHLPEFGVFTQEDIDIKECDFDKDASAVILFDDGFSDYDDDYKLITKRRIRIKILNDKGIDQGNIRIRFYSKDNFEYIQNISAVTFAKDDRGNYSSYSVDRKSFFTEKENNYYSSIKFAMPNIKAGSIFEYQYESVMRHYGGLDHWLFQSDIPTLKSSYFLQIIPNHEFEYVVQKKNIYPIVIRPLNERGAIYFEMSNIPGLKSEPYMDAVRDYMQRVEFQLSGYVNVFGSKTDVNNTWRKLADDLATDKNLGGALKKGLPQLDEIKALVLKDSSATARLNTIYNYVRNNFTWNEFYGKYAPDGIKTVWEKKTGSAGEINLVLLSLLQTFGIEAYPLLVAERDFGKIDTTYPLIDRFNKTVTYVIADNKTFILDATQKYCPAGLIPFPLLNTYAFIVDRKKYKLFRVASAGADYNNRVNVKATISEKGILNGNAVITSNDYSKQSRTEEIHKNEKSFVSNTFQQPYEGLKVDSFYCENLNNDAEPLIQHVKFENELSESGGFVFLKYNLFTGLEKNLFTKPERFTNIDFGFPYVVSVGEEIELPENAKIDDLPENKKLVTPNRDITISRKISREGNLLHIKIDFIQTVTLVYNEDYENLRQFYRTMTDMLNEPVVIKLAK